MNEPAPTPNDGPRASTPRLMLTVEEAAQRLDVSRTTMYGLIRSGAVASVRVGRLRRVPAAALSAYTEQNPHRADGSSADVSADGS